MPGFITKHLLENGGRFEKCVSLFFGKILVVNSLFLATNNCELKETLVFSRNNSIVRQCYKVVHSKFDIIEIQLEIY